MLQGEVLVLKLVAIDGLATSTVTGSEVATLAHEAGDHTVEGGALEPKSLLPGAESTEVLTGLGDNIWPQLHEDPANRSTISSDIKENRHSRHFPDYSRSETNALVEVNQAN